MIATKAHAYWQLMRMDKPIGTLLLLWPTLWALIISAKGIPNIKVLLVFVVGVLFMRSAGCAINDFADRKVDGFVKRTHQRPLPSGRVSAKEAISLFLILSLSSFMLVLTMNSLTIQLSFVALLLAFIYPFMKRYLYFPQLFLGLAYSWSIPMAWAAQTNELPAMAWYIFAMNAIWTIAYDTQYAMVDRDDDLKIGIKSTAILFGRWDKLIIGLLQLATLVMLIALGWWYALGASYYVSLVAVASLFIYQQLLTRDRECDGCFKAFLNNNYVGMVITAGLSLSFCL
ncbi:4-hydroxybenzoate octaprenyltransferase [Vibrio zhanjiangensis]|uniref:4-hydroxybenzoate octaprenyltransferase n=1 Tax=Vibrio zhanjiangensis TaxID=1046128 RepID=A0ABQ6F690_9VIBR|nr:4-hydroxybenzoate octaprenyltransferase [Vibrio zhanjiangensis]GLT20326.1 4-hydroxybenzoate octaprenyltransferase [Vibrio zhanjiangensis]